jgi:hypothetical protein
MEIDDVSSLGNFVWSIADQLRGVYRPHQYGDVILPMTILGDYAADESAEDRGGNPARLVASDEGLGDAEHTERGQGEATRST